MADNYGDSAALFRNERKSKESQPDYTGQGTINGTEYWLSSWIKEAKNSGKTYMSIAFTAKESAEGQPKAGEKEAVAAGSDVPF